MSSVLSPGVSSPVLPPPAVPPDLLFLHPFADPTLFQPAVANRPSDCSPSESELFSRPLVSPPGAECGGSRLSPLDSSPKPVLWVDKVKSSFQPLSKVASPSFSEDGVPSILAPDSISLASSDLWKDHIVAFFHGNPPSAAKVFTDLNPIWGKNGRISVKYHSKFCYLVYIPCVIARNWALDVAFWHSGNCSFTVAAWYPSINLSSMKLVHAPVWVIFRKVPRELWSLVGFSTLASAVGFPVHTESSDLKPYSNGVVKLRVVIELAKPRPSTARISDKNGNSVLVSTEFVKLPPKCSGCGEFGHFKMRCPTPFVNSPPAFKAFAHQYDVPQVPVPSSGGGLVASSSSGNNEHQAKLSFNGSGTGGGAVKPQKAIFPLPFEPSPADSASPNVASHGSIARSKSLPIQSGVRGDKSPELAWVEVSHRSKSKSRSKGSPSRDVVAVPILNSQFAEEEELISTAQRILRNRLAAVTPANLESSTVMSRKHARRKIRQQIYSLTSNDTGDGPLSPATVSSQLARFGLASGGQGLLPFVHSKEA